MSIDAEAIAKQMLSSATAAFGEQWDQVKTYAPSEFKKFAIQVADIVDNVGKYAIDPSQGYPPETGRVLLQMQRRALENVLTAMTALTLIAVQKAVNQVLEALKKGIGGAIAAILP